MQYNAAKAIYIPVVKTLLNTLRMGVSLRRPAVTALLCSMLAVPVQGEPGFAAGTPEVLFEGGNVLEQGGPNYAVSNDGERFVMIRRVGDRSAAPRIIIVQNWFEELKDLVPTD